MQFNTSHSIFSIEHFLLKKYLSFANKSNCILLSNDYIAVCLTAVTTIVFDGGLQLYQIVNIMFLS
jgi:hypothetical protein